MEARKEGEVIVPMPMWAPRALQFRSSTVIGLTDYPISKFLIWVGMIATSGGLLGLMVYAMVRGLFINLERGRVELLFVMAYVVMLGSLGASVFFWLRWVMCAIRAVVFFHGWFKACRAGQTAYDYGVDYWLTYERKTSRPTLREIRLSSDVLFSYHNKKMDEVERDLPELWRSD